MQKRNLKVLINDLERAIAEIKSEVYSDTSAYRIDKGDGVKSKCKPKLILKRFKSSDDYTCNCWTKKLS